MTQPRFNRISRTLTLARAFRFAVVATALVIAALALQSRFRPDGALVFCLTLAIASEAWPLFLPKYGAMSLADAMIYALTLLGGPFPALLAVLGSGVMRFARQHRQGQNTELSYVAYSISQRVLTYVSAALVYGCFSTHPSLMSGRAGLVDLGLFATACVAGCCLQTLIVATHQWIDQKQVGVVGSRLNWSRMRLSLQVLAPLGLLQAVALQQSFVAGLTLVGPMIVTYLTIRNYTDTLREAQEVLGNLADAVEKREPHTVGHASRVASIATDLARELRLPEAEVRSVARAAQLHELGKISLADHILVAGGVLVQKDWDQVRRYPEVGAKVVSVLSLSRREAEIIRFHQECFDGGGYPYGRKGGDIPLGSRILCVAKAFDAMISWRSYRQPLSMSQALNRLCAGSGIKFDPKVVDALVRLRKCPQAQIQICA
jgi:HD-GYP domain-containing protein (c-di-GMP phosphodiesterase class II)